MKYRLPRGLQGIKIVTSEISDGPMNFNLPEGKENIKKFLAKFKISKPLASCSQPHGIKIAVAEKPGRIEGADGILTAKDYVLAIKTADCVPLVIFDQNTNLIGAIHVSRKNLLAGIISKSLAFELKRLKAQSSNELKAFLGPHIRVANYPLKVESAMEIKKTSFKQFLVQIEGKIHFDLTKAVISELEKIGFNKDNIGDSGIDTYASGVFYSARRQSVENPKVFLSVVYKR